MPTRNSGEPESAFISRCMDSAEMKGEFPDNRQRYAVCQSKLREEKKEGESPKHEKSESKSERRMEGE